MIIPKASPAGRVISKAGLCFNIKGQGATSDDDAEYDEPATIEFLRDQIASLGLSVTLYEQDDTLFERLRADRPEFVFNIAEGIGQGRSRESQVPILLEWLKIPYYGSDPLALGITLDKYLTNVCLARAGITVPTMVVVADGSLLSRRADLFDGRRYIVKPRWEGSSKGIYERSLVSTFDAARDAIAFINKHYAQPAVMEEFIDGEEITVGVVGNAAPVILGAMCIRPVERDKPFIYSIEHKRTWRDTIRYSLAKDVLSAPVLATVSSTVLGAFHHLELRDAARIDVRLDAKGKAHVIDVNPLPGLSPEYSDLMLMTHLQGQDFSEIVRHIIRTALLRNGLCTHHP